MVFQTGFLNGPEAHLYQVRLVDQLALEIPISNPQPHHIHLFYVGIGKLIQTLMLVQQELCQPNHPQQTSQQSSFLSSYPPHIVLQQ